LKQLRCQAEMYVGIFAAHPCRPHGRSVSKIEQGALLMKI
jgi:hypothetical protein